VKTKTLDNPPPYVSQPKASKVRMRSNRPEQTSLQAAATVCREVLLSHCATRPLTPPFVAAPVGAVLCAVFGSGCLDALTGKQAVRVGLEHQRGQGLFVRWSTLQDGIETLALGDALRGIWGFVHLGHLLCSFETIVSHIGTIVKNFFVLT